MTKEAPSTTVETPEVMPAQRGRPQKILKLVPGTLPEHASKIAAYHQAAQDCLARGAMYAVLCGLELHAAQARCEHGEWLPWLEKNVTFPARTAQRYMQAAEMQIAKLSNASRVTYLAELTDGTLDESKRARLMQAVQDSLETMTARQLYFDLGIMKSPQLPQGGWKGGAGHKLSEEEKRHILRESWKSMLIGLRKWVLDQRNYVHLTEEEIKAGVSTLKDVSHHLISHNK